MSDTPDQVQAEAREIGWRPKEEFKGDPSLWVDADEFLRRGQTVLPLVKAENRRLHDKTDAMAREIQRLTTVVAEQMQSMGEFREFAAQQLADKLAEQKRQINTKLREARREEDDALVETLEEQLEENAEARDKLKKTAAAAPTAPAAPQTVQETPEYIAWAKANPWFNGTSEADQAKTAAAQAFGVQVAREGKRGAAFFEAVDAKMAKAYPQPTRTDPTEDGRPQGGSGTDGSTSSRNSGFNALPADAKAKAKEQTSRFVGPNKMFKTEADWFKYYAQQYNQEA